MSKILITGAAGFIGSQLAHRLWQDGEDVILVDNFSYGKYDNLQFDDIDFSDVILKEDIRDRSFIDKLFEKESFDYVYHIAAVTPLPDCQTDPYNAVDNNITGTVNLLEASRKYGAKNFIFASTSAVYENCTQFPTGEDDVLPPTLIYSSSKYLSEHLCKSYVDAYGMNAAVLRFANVYGPHIDCLRTQPPVAGYIIRELYFGNTVQLHSDGNQQRDFIYVDDLVELAVRAKDSKGYDVFNVSSAETHSINEMYEIIAAYMGKADKKPENLPTEHYWYRYLALYEGAYPIHSEIMENEVLKHTECSNAHAKAVLSWMPKVSFEEGLKNTVDFSIDVLKRESKCVGEE